MLDFLTLLLYQTICCKIIELFTNIAIILFVIAFFTTILLLITFVGAKFLKINNMKIEKILEIIKENAYDFKRSKIRRIEICENKITIIAEHVGLIFGMKGNNVNMIAEKINQIQKFQLLFTDTAQLAGLKSVLNMAERDPKAFFRHSGNNLTIYTNLQYDIEEIRNFVNTKYRHYKIDIFNFVSLENSENVLNLF